MGTEARNRKPKWSDSVRRKPLNWRRWSLGKAWPRGAAARIDFHGNQSGQSWILRRVAVLRSSGSRKERGQMDEAFLPHIQRQSDANATVCLGVQPGELPATTCTASRCRALVADDTAREAGEDRSQGGAPSTSDFNWPRWR